MEKQKLRTVVCDIETNGLEDEECTKLWLIVATDVDTEETFEFLRPDLSPNSFVRFMEEVDTWIGHNFLSFDAYQIERLVKGAKFDYTKIIDTLVISRLIHYNITGGHSLNAWGKRMGCPKINFNEFSRFSEDMRVYCNQDVTVNLKLYKHFVSRGWLGEDWQQSLKVEHETALICSQMKRDGFPFDIKRAKELYQEVLTELDKLDKVIQETFPPFIKSQVTYTPRAKADGTVSKMGLPRDTDISKCQVGVPFTITTREPFNPKSPRQVVTRLNKAGWKPTEKTKGHDKILREKNPDPDKLAEFKEFGWKVSETNLNTLPTDAPEGAKQLKKWLVLDSRRLKFVEWFDAYNPKTGCIHGTIFHIGAWTGRKSHSKPNQANILSEYDNNGNIQYLGKEMRELWTTTKYSSSSTLVSSSSSGASSYLVGTDADGIQLRVLSHYLRNADYRRAILEGDKDLGTDIHSLNKKALGVVCKTRDASKTFIYAWLLGAGLGKVQEILSSTYEEAKTANQSFIKSTVGLEELKNDIIPRDARNGYFVGLDGRKVVCGNQHLMLAGYLQNGETVIMKHANVEWRNELKGLGIKFIQRNDVHDEWQTEIFGTKEEAERAGEVQRESLTKMGEVFGLFCPLSGSTSIGNNWYETH